MSEAISLNCEAENGGDGEDGREDEADHEAQLFVLSQMPRGEKWRLRSNSLKGALLFAKRLPLGHKGGECSFLGVLL